MVKNDLDDIFHIPNMMRTNISNPQVDITYNIGIYSNQNMTFTVNVDYVMPDEALCKEFSAKFISIAFVHLIISPVKSVIMNVLQQKII